MKRTLTQPQNSTNPETGLCSDFAIVGDLNGSKLSPINQLANGSEEREPPPDLQSLWAEHAPNLAQSAQPPVAESAPSVPPKGGFASLGDSVAEVMPPRCEKPRRDRAAKANAREEKRRKARDSEQRGLMAMRVHNAGVRESGLGLLRLNTDAVGRARRCLTSPAACTEELARMPRHLAGRLKLAMRGDDDGSPRWDHRQDTATRSRRVCAVGVLLYLSGEYRRKRATLEVSGISQSCIASALGISLASLKRSGADGGFGFGRRGTRASKRGIDAQGWRTGDVGYLPALGQVGFVAYHQPPAHDVAPWERGPVRFDDDGNARQYAYCVYCLFAPASAERATREQVRSDDWAFAWLVQLETGNRANAPPD